MCVTELFSPLPVAPVAMYLGIRKGKLRTVSPAPSASPGV